MLAIGHTHHVTHVSSNVNANVQCCACQMHFDHCCISAGSNNDWNNWIVMHARQRPLQNAIGVARAMHERTELTMGSHMIKATLAASSSVIDCPV